MEESRNDNHVIKQSNSEENFNSFDSFQLIYKNRRRSKDYYQREHFMRHRGDFDREDFLFVNKDGRGQIYYKDLLDSRHIFFRDGKIENVSLEGWNLSNSQFTDIDQLKKEVNFLENRLKSLELQDQLSLYKKGRFWPEKYTAYILMALVFIGGSWFVFKTQVNKDNIQISIEYDVGVIMAGVLTGTAALIAATSYAKRSHSISHPGNREGR